MSAEAIADHLSDDARREGSQWRTRCPLCNAAMMVRDGDRGLLVKCWGGCAGRDVLGELRRLGLLDGRAPAPLSAEEITRRQARDDAERKRKIAAALDLWKTGVELRDTIADTYLRLRGLDAYSPFIGEHAGQVLRFHPHCRYCGNIYRPALLARIDHEAHGFIGVSATYLAIDGSGKAALDPPRLVTGFRHGGAIRLGEPIEDKWLAIGEGIETTLSVMQSAELPGWAAVCANGIEALVLPPEARMVLICADNDANQTGQRAARKAARRFLAEGRRVRIITPPIVGQDFNDVLMGRVAGEDADAA